MTVQRILFVCTGNICRSPTAEGVLRQMAAARGLAERIDVASAGIEGWHAGAPPDERSQAHALRRGIDLSAQRARHFARRDFERYDWIIAMDAGHHEHLARLCPPAQRHKIRRAAEFAASVPAGGVPDPYFGGARGFEEVLDMIEAMCAGIVAELSARPAAGR